VTAMVPTIIGWFAGAEQVETSLPLADRPWLAWTAALLFLAVAARLAFLTLSDIARARAQIERTSFAWYLLAVGAIAVAAFLASTPTLNGYSRYSILGLLIRVGASAALLALEPRAAVRRAFIAGVGIWVVLSTADNARLLLINLREPPPNPVRE